MTFLDTEWPETRELSVCDKQTRGFSSLRLDSGGTNITSSLGTLGISFHIHGTLGREERGIEAVFHSRKFYLASVNS